MVAEVKRGFSQAEALSVELISGLFMILGAGALVLGGMDALAFSLAKILVKYYYNMRDSSSKILPRGYHDRR